VLVSKIYICQVSASCSVSSIFLINAFLPCKAETDGTRYFFQAHAKDVATRAHHLLQSHKHQERVWQEELDHKVSTLVVARQAAAEQDSTAALDLLRCDVA
jgi:hypothetical protein